MMEQNASSLIPVIFCIDAEPDPRLVTRHSPEPWVGYETTYRYLSELRPRLEEQTGRPVRYSWFFRMDPQISESYGSAAYPLERYPNFVREMQHHGDELAIHTHAYRWSEKENNWYHDLGNDWVAHCLRTSFEAYQLALGTACVSYRGGDYWLSTHAVNLLEQMGVRFDLTVEPGLRPGKVMQPGMVDWKFIPRYYRVPRTPYAPLKSDFRKAGRSDSRSILMIPVTSTYLEGLPIYSQMRRIVFNGFRNRHQETPLQMWLSRKPPNTFESLIDRAIAVQKKPYLVLTIRSDTSIRPKLAKGFGASIQSLLSHPARSRFAFCTPAEAMKILGT
jgi:hypothetical protein